MTEECLVACSLVKALLPTKDAKRKVSKLIVASCQIWFDRRSTIKKGVGWDSLIDLDLIEEQEAELLQEHVQRMKGGSQPSFMVLHWALQYVQKFVPDLENRDDALNLI